MKLSASLIISLLPLLAVANPVAEPNPDPAALEARDYRCNILPRYEYADGRSGKGIRYKVEHRFRRNDHFNIRCKSSGDSYEGSREWYYVPSYNCWLPYVYLGEECRGNKN